MESGQASAVASAAASEDLHASLEAQLRSSQADVGRLQNEVTRLKVAAASAADAQSFAESPASSGSRTAKAQAGLEQQLRRSQAEVLTLREEVGQLRSAAIVIASSNAEQRQAQPASTSGQSNGGPDLGDVPGVAPAELSQAEADGELQQRLRAAELERDKAKQQLSRCALCAMCVGSHAQWQVSLTTCCLHAIFHITQLCAGFVPYRIGPPVSSRLDE